MEKNQWMCADSHTGAVVSYHNSEKDAAEEVKGLNNKRQEEVNVKLFPRWNAVPSNYWWDPSIFRWRRPYK